MIGALMGVPGKLKTLLDRLTSTRATALDNLDAAISTRASASVWTGALATELDGLAPAIAAIPTTPINSIQYNTVTIRDAHHHVGEHGQVRAGVSRWQLFRQHDERIGRADHSHQRDDRDC